MVRNRFERTCFRALMSLTKEWQQVLVRVQDSHIPLLCSGHKCYTPVLQPSRTVRTHRCDDVNSGKRGRYAEWTSLIATARTGGRDVTYCLQIVLPKVVIEQGVPYYNTVQVETLFLLPAWNLVLSVDFYLLDRNQVLENMYHARFTRNRKLKLSWFEINYSF